MNEVKLAIAGDLYINEKSYSNKIIGSQILDIFQRSDYSILNLEAPIIENEQKLKINKTGPHLQIDVKIADLFFEKVNTDLVTLANNHIMDYGDQGLRKTIDFCIEKNIKYVGGGSDVNEARRTFSLEIGGRRIAILNFAENEWTIAGERKPGANPLDIIDNIKDIQHASENHDIVIVVIHGGNEYSDYPSPRMVKQYRFYAENGASAIIGHHPHCISGYEVHYGVPIFYSLGNFLFTKNSKFEKWYKGLLLTLTIKKDNSIKFKIHPTKVDKYSFQIDLAKGEEKKLIFNKLSEINSVILNDTLLQKEWHSFVKGKEEEYLMTLSPFGGIKNKYLRAIAIRSGLYKMSINSNYAKQVLNRIRCEAHLDVTKQVLEDKLN